MNFNKKEKGNRFGYPFRSKQIRLFYSAKTIT